MAHFAEIDAQGVVLRVVVCDPDDGNDGATNPPVFLTDVLGGTWVRTYYDTPGRTFAGIGYTWDADTDDFNAPPMAVVLDDDPELKNDALVNPELNPPGG